ncbi:MAG: RNA methyltransferase [Maribacter sp.]|nr:RNA methyltransferase [Maribacter sp.]
MVGKSQIKFIKSLQQKKYRIQYGMFVVEGIKTVQELLNSHFIPHMIFCTDSDILVAEKGLVEIISETDLKKMSTLKNPNKVLGVFKFNEPQRIDEDDWILALDDIRDPGNLGTIIRLCDWFGISHLLCSKNTVDCYNPKVLQASMGSIARVNIVYTDLVEFIKNTRLPIYGTYMNSNSIYSSTLPKKGILIMGNEANGISNDVGKMITSKVSIPHFGANATESLNVATATAILLNEIRRT